jgi:hypothetical protein
LGHCFAQCHPLLGGATHRFPLAQRLSVAWGDIGELRIETDRWRNLPRSRAFSPLGEARNDRNSGNIRQSESFGWTIALN